MKYYSIHEFCKIINRTPQTLRNCDKSGRLTPDHTGANGYRYYSETQLNRVLQKTDDKEKYVVGYCRVSSNKQKDDLDRQVENMSNYLISQGKPFIIVKDIGSGINYKRKGLKEVVLMIMNRQVDKIVLLYKDRLLGFGYELIEYIASINDCRIEIVDNTQKNEEQELVEDLVQIITVFSCRLQGKRANKAKKMIKELIEDDIVQES